jgi:CheY-like chemotaxis protein
MSETTIAAHPAAPLRVMLLDDDPFMLELLHGMLDELGSFDVLRETCARRALRTLPTNAPDLLVCDLSLPEMDGIEFMQAASRTGFTGEVLLLSGMDKGVRNAAEGLASAYGLRVVGSFAKPLPLDALRGIVDRLLDARLARGSYASGPSH